MQVATEPVEPIDSGLKRLTRGVFLQRVNRFVVSLEIDRRVTTASMANPGRMGELLLPGATLLFFRSDPRTSRVFQEAILRLRRYGPQRLDVGGGEG